MQTLAPTFPCPMRTVQVSTLRYSLERIIKCVVLVLKYLLCDKSYWVSVNISITLSHSLSLSLSPSLSLSHSISLSLSLSLSLSHGCGRNGAIRRQSEFWNKIFAWHCHFWEVRVIKLFSEWSLWFILILFL